MPILITTLSIIAPEEREQVKGMIQRVLLKKEGVEIA